MNNIIYIISLKYAQGLKKEFIAVGNNFRKQGFQVRYLLAKPYKYLGHNPSFVNYVTVSNNLKSMLFDTFLEIYQKKILNIFSKQNPSLLFFYNTHPLNPFLAQLAKKKFPSTIVTVYLHDPFKPDKKPYGIKKSFIIKFVETIQKRTVKFSDYVISPSKYSSELFNRYYKNFKGKNYIAPLLIPDCGNLKIKKREFFVNIQSGVHPATGQDTFIDLINYVAEKGKNYRFVLISHGNISKFLSQLTKKGHNIVKIINKKIITEEEINNVVQKSYGVFRLAREVTQSGVIPVAFMNSAPIIARNIPGHTQDIQHNQNGYIVPFDCKMEDLVLAMDYIKINFGNLSKNSRKKYKEIWDEQNWEKYYNKIEEVLKR
ncbi:MAG: glycosyltransferase [Candidatus Omnitrophica bacterium]|nr:glycosyltransferase [Candidatus Omnitrophota bacterium]